MNQLHYSTNFHLYSSDGGHVLLGPSFSEMVLMFKLLVRLGVLDSDKLKLVTSHNGNIYARYK